MKSAWIVLAGACLLACEPDELSRMDEELADAAVAPPRAHDGGRAQQHRDAAIEDAAIADASAPDADPMIAREPLYVCSERSLYSYDPATSTMHLIGSFSPFTGESMIDIAIDRQGHLYGGTFAGGIYRIDPSTAEVSRLSTLLNIPTGLTFLFDGRLIVAGARVFAIDPATGNTSALITSAAPQTSGDIIALPDGSLYASVIAGDAYDDLVKIDPQSGEVVRIGSLGVAGVFGLGWANGEMYGFTDEGDAMKIDPATGRVSDRRSFSEPFYGATTNPVAW